MGMAWALQRRERAGSQPCVAPATPDPGGVTCDLLIRTSRGPDATHVCCSHSYFQVRKKLGDMSREAGGWANTRASGKQGTACTEAAGPHAERSWSRVRGRGAPRLWVHIPSSSVTSNLHDRSVLQFPHIASTADILSLLGLSREIRSERQYLYKALGGCWPWEPPSKVTLWRVQCP